MKTTTAARAAATLTLASLAACVTRTVPPGEGATASAAATTSTTMTTTAGGTTAQGDWKPLIDPGMSAWRGYKSQTMPASWRVADGVLTKSGGVEDLVSRDQYGDFELSWDWMLDAGGNAGVFYRTSEEYDKVYWSGPEYQLLDDARHPDGRNALTSAGAAYGLYAPPRGVVKPAGEWNSSRIVARGNHVQHWLNGQKVVEYELGSPDWTAKVQASKFREWPMYGRLARGRIGIQGDHSGSLALRNIRIKVLP
jgi:hypothetical protein